MLNLGKQDIDLSTEERSGRLVLHWANSHSLYKLPCEIPIRAREARYKSNHKVSGLNIVPILQTTSDVVQEVNIMVGEIQAV